MATPARPRHLKAIDLSLSAQPPAITPAGRERELADLRYFWGGAYRITWQGRFRATHLKSGEAVEADTATAMREVLLDHQWRHGHDA